MELEKQRGISVTSSVMQFPYAGRIVNLLDTPGHEDFSEDTYRTLTAVDSALMVIDAAKGVEERTIKLMEVCRLRDTPIMTFINKLDREGANPIELLDEVESVLGSSARRSPGRSAWASASRASTTWSQRRVHLYSPATAARSSREVIQGLTTTRACDERCWLAGAGAARGAGTGAGASPQLRQGGLPRRPQTPVFFGSAINNFGVQELLDDFVEHAPPPAAARRPRAQVEPSEPAFTGFVFKIQANMDPQHRDRIAFCGCARAASRRA
jgi:peptide chain release factor 3